MSPTIQAYLQKSQDKRGTFALECQIKDFLNKIYSKTRCIPPKFQKIGIAIPMRTSED